MNDELTITVLGAGSCVPDPGYETSSFCINGCLLVDTGWCAAQRMRQFGLDPTKIEAVLLSHCHHDHYMGLVSILFSQGLAAWHEKTGMSLDVYGPVGEVQRVVDDGLRFLQADNYPNLPFGVRVQDLASGDERQICGLRVSALSAPHNAPALHYRIETTGGKAVTISGDTPFDEQLADFAQGSDLLIHEASLGWNVPDSDEERAHSTAAEAAEIARRAGVDRLALVHVNNADDINAPARERVPFADAFVPAEGEVLRL